MATGSERVKVTGSAEKTGYETGNDDGWVRPKGYTKKLDKQT
jgi:hypothetical protein